MPRIRFKNQIAEMMRWYLQVGKDCKTKLRKYICLRHNCVDNRTNSIKMEVIPTFKHQQRCLVCGGCHLQSKNRTGYVFRVLLYGTEDWMLDIAFKKTCIGLRITFVVHRRSQRISWILKIAN